VGVRSPPAPETEGDPRRDLESTSPDPLVQYDARGSSAEVNALYTCLPDAGIPIKREILLEEAARGLGHPDLTQKVRRSLNDTILSERRGVPPPSPPHRFTGYASRSSLYVRCFCG
jgi:hypothetical protein